MDRPKLRDEFYSMQPSSPADRYHDEMGFRQQKRQDRYDVYDAMDTMSDVSSVLDAYAEDATQEDHQKKKTVWIESSDKKLKIAGNKLLHKTLNVEDVIEAMARDVAKQGDDFGIIKADPKSGVTSIFWRDPRDIERIENKDGILLGFEETAKLGSYKQKVTASIQAGGDGSEIKPTYEPWEVLHVRRWTRKRLPREKWPNIYGTSVLAGSERIAKQTKILDDLLMIMRLTRSVDRKTYFVDVGRSPVEEEVRILKRWRRALKRKTYVDPATGRFDSRFDPFGWTEDEFWPVKEGSNSRVETQAGITDVKEIVDIEHFRDKFFGSLRAPKAYFGYEGDVNAKATLSSQSVKWARAVQSVQRALKQAIKRLLRIHFAWLGLNTSADAFDVMMTEPSLVELLDKLEAWQAIIDVAERMSTAGESLGVDKKDWTTYILQHVFWFSKSEAFKFIRGLKSDEETDDEDGKPSSVTVQHKADRQPQDRQPPAAFPSSAPPSPDAGEKPPSGEGPPKESNGSNGQSRRIRLSEIDNVIRLVADRAGKQALVEDWTADANQAS
jgi:hypothetical protein